MAPSQYLNQYWLILSVKVPCHSSLSIIWEDLNTLRPRQNGCHFADDTFKRIFLKENVRISIKISLKFVPKSPIDNIPALFQIMSSIVVGLCPLCCTNCLLAVVVFSSSCSCPVAVMGRVTTSSKCSWGWLIDSWRNGIMTARGPILLERLWFRNSYSGRNQVGAMMGQK